MRGNAANYCHFDLKSEVTILKHVSFRPAIWLKKSVSILCEWSVKYHHHLSTSRTNGHKSHDKSWRFTCSVEFVIFALHLSHSNTLFLVGVHSKYHYWLSCVDVRMVLVCHALCNWVNPTVFELIFLVFPGSRFNQRGTHFDCGEAIPFSDKSQCTTGELLLSFCHPSLRLKLKYSPVSVLWSTHWRSCCK